MTVIHADDDNVNMDVLFPIRDEDKLQVFEEKSKDFDFRSTLEGKIALLVGNKDLGNSIRRIMTRMFDDQFLYALRKHLKYKHNTDKEIDIPLGTWLAHTPFRLKTKKQSEEEEQ
ncbi:uncharacterized protein LOC132953565 [Metopolophium dirhodum]|uniref:uncharacterized protein LOC132953565 n=1 Tax=Metopolophium dirhodum TaxID=44670 RepID=UPI002990709A|nr:uncharacterized protein LOC132953565 [Metopolophium dirhodum]